jgi:hypothetical protein
MFSNISLMFQTMLIAIAATLFVIFALPTPSTIAGFVDGSWLQAQCEADAHGACLAYLMGVVDALNQAESITDRTLICLPTEVTAGQLRLVVLKALQERPEQLHYSAVDIVTRAVSFGFPCPIR